MEQLTDSERNHYEQTISRLSGASTLTKGLLILVVILLTINAGILYNNGIQQRNRSRLSVKRNQTLISTIQKNDKSQNALIQSQLNTVNRHIDCVISFFTVQDRLNLTITDIDNCTLNKSGEPLQPNISFPGTVPISPTTTQSKPATSQPAQSSSGSAGQAAGSSGSSTNTPPPAKKAPLNCTVDILFLHIGCD